MSWGFVDGGESFEAGLEILDSSYNLYDWLSPETRALIDEEEQIMMVDYQFSEAKERYMEYFDERSSYFLANFEPKTLEVFVEFVVVYMLEFNGKFTVMSPIFTAYAPILILFNMISLQFFSNAYYHHYWAHGNAFLVFMTFFGFFQYMCMFMLLQNTDAYLYDFRLTRYVSLFLAMSFDLVYLAVLYRVYDLLFIKAMKEKTTNPFDLISVVVLGYGVTFFAPDFFINMLIFLKELTLSQTAWTKEDDYPEGYALDGKLNIDILSWIGVEEEIDWYVDYFKEWCQEFC